MTERELVERALEMRRFSYAPYSHFRVGAALECEDGSVYTGCNVENAAYGSSLCRRRFVRLAVAGDSADYCWPCGACRQMLREFGTDLEVLAANREGAYVSVPLEELLPHSFGPETLG